MPRDSKTPLDPDRLPAGKMLSWAGAGISAGANFILLGYLSLYATDTLGVSASVVGVIILVSSLANAVGGLIAAWIVDRTPETRFGKARPYEFAVIGIWLATWAMYSTPAGLGETGRIAWLFVTYLLINVVFDTLLRANDSLYLARAFANRRVYAKVLTRGGIFTTLASIVISIVLPVALDQAGRDPGKWSVVMLAFAVPLAVIGMTRFLFVKEEFKSVEADQPPVKMRELLSALRTGKLVWILAGMMMLVSAVNGANMISYYFRYIVGNLSLQGVSAALGVIILPTVLILPLLMRRFAISQILLVGAGLGLVGSAFYWLADGSLPLVMAGGVLIGVATLPVSYLIGVMILDVCSYNEWQGARRLESTLGAIVGVSGRVGIGFAGLIVGQVLSGAGYDGTQDTQSQSALDAIVGLFADVPAVAFLGIAVLMALYMRFDRQLLPVIQAELEQRHAAEAEAVEDGEAALTASASGTAEPVPPARG